MAVEIKVPDMGESVIEATIARWMKNEGDAVAAGEPLVELETDKVNVEVGAQQAGVLQQIQKQVGDTVAVGDVLAFVAASGESVPATGQAAAGQVVVDSTAGPGPDTGEAEAREAAIRDASQEESTGAQTGGVPYEGGLAESEKSTAPQSQPAGGKQEAPSASSGPVTVTPVAQRMAQEQGIDLAQVKPSSGGRITKEDVQAYLEKNRSGAAPQAVPTPAPATPQTTAPRPEAPAAPRQQATQPAAAPSLRDGREVRERMTRRRQTIARRLVEAQQTAAMLTTFNEVDMSAVMDLRKRRRDGFKERFGVDLGFMPFFIKAVIGALKAFPYLNAEIQGEEIVQKRYYDIGIAIGAEEGLVVPVVRDADRLSFADIEKAIRGYVTKSKEGTLSLEDLRGGTFTITNGGVYGSLLSTPILNPPQVGILGMHAIKERAVVIDGQIVARPMMYLALSYDHRIVDGREAVQFLVRVKELLEDPETLLFS